MSEHARHDRLTRRTLLELATGSAFAASGGRPNILFICVDDLNDWVGCLGGHPQTRTPNIDRLARSGLLFRHAYCSAPICNPSRTSLLSGLRPSTTGSYQNTQPFRNACPGVITLPGWFKRNGYRTVGRGKIFHLPKDGEGEWDDYAPVNGNTRPAGRLNDWRLDGGPLDISDDQMGDAITTRWAADQLSKLREPFFLAAGLIRPHENWFVPRKYFDMHPLAKVVLPEVKADDLDDLPPLGREIAECIGDYENLRRQGQEKYAAGAYLACVSFADAMIGRLIDALDRSAHAANTIIVLFGDNGFHLRTKLHWRKNTLWEEATRVPLIIRAPGMTKAGSVCDRPVSLLDLYPTLLELSSLPRNEKLEGRSLVPLLRNPSARWDTPVITTYGRGNHTVRTERWRYIRYSDGGEELYDHAKDPREWRNLASLPAFARVKAQLAAHLPKGNAENALTAAGSRDAKPWHIDFAHLRGKEIRFIPW